MSVVVILRSAWAITAAYVLLALLLAIPMLCVSIPLGVDTIDHLARIYVRAHIETDPDLARIFRVRDDIIPYLVMDWLLTPLARVMPIMVVGRLYIVALVWGLVAAVAVLRLTFLGRIGWVPLAAGLVAYNGLLAWGFLNFLLGFELALMAFAAWHATRELHVLTRLIAFTAISTVIYLSHVVAFALYGLAVASYELVGRGQLTRMRWTDWMVLAGQAVPALFLWHTVTLHPSLNGIDLTYGVGAKILALESPFLFRGAAGGWDPGTYVLLVVLTVMFLAARRGLLVLSRLLGAPALALAAAAVLTPTWLMNVFLLDSRFPLAIACFLIAGLQWRVRSRALNGLIAATIAFMTVVRVADVTILMQGCDTRYQELTRSLALLPRGADLTLVTESRAPNTADMCTWLPFGHAAELVTIERSGYSTGFFSAVTSVAVKGDRTSDALSVDADEFSTAPARGYVLWMHFGHRRATPPGLNMVQSGSYFALYQAQSNSSDR